MTLRAKLLTLFAALAVVPLLGVGVFDYVRSIRAMESLVTTQTFIIATAAASELADRHRALEANVALLGDNAETADMFRVRSLGQPRWHSLRERMDTFLSEAWLYVGRDLLWVSYRSPEGLELYRRGDPDTRAFVRSLELTREVRGDRGAIIGRVVVAARLDSLLPEAALRNRFGRRGVTAVFDAARDTLLYAAGDDGADARFARAPRPELRAGDTANVTRVLLRDDGAVWLGTRVRIPGTPFIVVSLASRDELLAPFADIRASNLVAVVILTLLVAFAFVVLLWRGTRPLADLTVAADQVARGNLEPPLPGAGGDEAGRLARAFAYMLERIRGMLTEVERSRQMAAIGEFASQISHEIRNPLTAIKLNLQKLERGAEHGLVAAELRRPLEISLQEIHRLDNVVRGVLRLGRPAAGMRRTFALREVAQRAIDATRAQLERQRIAVVVADTAGEYTVTGHPELLHATVVNLLLNAAEAMPGGGTIHVLIERPDDATVRLRVEDDGPGIPSDDRERVFAPFFTTKPSGSGLGLALAQRTVEEHRGAIAAVEPLRGRGAALTIDLPRTPEGRA